MSNQQSDLTRIFDEIMEEILFQPIEAEMQQRFIVQVFKHLYNMGWRDLVSSKFFLNPIVYSAYEEFTNGVQ